MQGAVNYLRQVKVICRKHMGDCRSCPLGDKPKLKECMCPRLLEPWKWTDEMTTEMVRTVTKNQAKGDIGNK